MFNRGTVAKYGIAVSDRKHFIKLVRDEQNGATLIAQTANDLQQFLRFVMRQCSGRLIHDHHPCVMTQRACNLHQMFLCNRQLTQGCIHRQL